jgi:SAM (Sterile alpha motif) domain-containing protein
VDVGEWLKSLGLEQYEAAFRENAITAALLPNLTADDLKDLGITLVLLCHFLARQLLPLPQTARAPGQRLDQADGELTADGGNRVRHMPLRPHRQRLVAGSRRVGQVS